MFETIGFYFIAASSILVVAASVWLLINAYRASWKWGLSLTLFPPLSLLFVFKRWNYAKSPLILGLAGTVIASGTIVVDRLIPIDLGPRETLVEGELHITLTGWDQSDYSVLRRRPNIVVLQMANADVTDETLDLLTGMEHLKELDLSSTQITDLGLSKLATIKSLTTLRLGKTKITETGFSQYILPLENLMQLDVTGLGIKGKTLREWKKQVTGRRYIN